MENQPLILRPKAVCAELGISTATFWRLVKAGKIKAITLSPKTRGVRREDLIAYLEQAGG